MSQAVDGMLAEALSVDTRAERLREIYGALRSTSSQNARQRQIGAALAGNPNTPPDVLAGLFEENHREVFRNPAFSLILLSNPEFARSLTPRGVQQALYDAEAPALFVRSILLAPPEGGPRWNNNPSTESLQAEARQHVSLTGELEPSLWRKAVRALWREYAGTLSDERRSACAELADYGLLPAEYTAMAEDLFAGDPGAELERLLDEPRSRQIREMIAHARNPGTPPDDIRHYAADPLGWLHFAVALNPAAPPDALLSLIRHRPAQTQPAYLRSLARHPQAGQEVLGYLTGFALTRNPPRESYMPILASVCRLVMRHPNATPELREAIRSRSAVTAPAISYYDKNNTSGDNHLCRFALCLASGSGWDQSGKSETLRYFSAPERLSAALLLPLDQLDALIQDGNQVVRAAAQARRRGEMFAWDAD